MGPKFVARYLVTLTAFGLLILSSVPCLADTPDLTEFMTNTYPTVLCTNQAMGIFADVDGNGTNDTMVVFNTIQGEAYSEYGPGLGYGNYDYFYSQINSHCGGSYPYPNPGKFTIWFVDMLALGFVANTPSSWTFKSVPRVDMVVIGDVSSGVSTPIRARQVNAYTERLQGGSLVGSFVDTNGTPMTCNFTNGPSIKEIYLRTDFGENSILYFSIRSSLSGGGGGSGADIGLRANDGTSVIKIAGELPGAGGTLSSRFRITKNGTNYGVLLTATNSPDASKFRVQTSSGIKAIQKLP